MTSTEAKPSNSRGGRLRRPQHEVQEEQEGTAAGVTIEFSNAPKGAGVVRGRHLALPALPSTW